MERQRMSSSGRTGSLTPTQDLSPASSGDGGDDGEELVYLAVGKEYKESETTLVWTLKNNPLSKKIVLLHVHRPALMIPIMGGWFLPSQLGADQVESYRNLEREKIDTNLDNFTLVCDRVKVQTERLVIENDDVAKGILELISQHGITRLVMGAAADKSYSKKMTSPKSKTACTVRKEAPPFCKIWFICKGKLITTREASVGGYRISQSLMACPSPKNGNMYKTDSLSSKLDNVSNRMQDLLNNSSRSDSDTSLGSESGRPSLSVMLEESTTPKSLYDEKGGFNHGEKDSPRGYEDTLLSGVDETVKKVDLNSVTGNKRNDDTLASKMIRSAKFEEATDASKMRGATKFEERTDASNGQSQQDDTKSDDYDLYCQLQQALLEAAKLKDEAHEESLKRRRAEMELLEANRRAKTFEMKYTKEMKLRTELEEELAREKAEIQRLESERDEVFKDLQVKSDQLVKGFEEKLEKAQDQIDKIRGERDDAIREVEELEQLEEEEKEGKRKTYKSPNFLEFSFAELEQATGNFDESLKIGVGGYGSVFRGFLRHTVVAVKMLHPQNLKGRVEFHEEVEVISRLRHPNLTNLIGASPEACALIYEFLPNGSLEDRLACKDDTPPLPWEVRVRIIVEICSALIFLHSNKPGNIFHGDLRPANILLDANFVSKITDFGINRFVQSTTTLYRWTDPKGSFVYLDPEFFSTGELNASSDIYSFGIVVLRLVTGKSALGIVKDVQEALECRNPVVDTAAGNWPAAQARQLVIMGLRCCEMNRRNRPDLVKDVWKILEPMKKVASHGRPSSS